jgi:hypothetical protein
MSEITTPYGPGFSCICNEGVHTAPFERGRRSPAASGTTTLRPDREYVRLAPRGDAPRVGQSGRLPRSGRVLERRPRVRDRAHEHLVEPPSLDRQQGHEPCHSPMARWDLARAGRESDETVIPRRPNSSDAPDGHRKESAWKRLISCTRALERTLAWRNAGQRS